MRQGGTGHFQAALKGLNLGLAPGVGVFDGHDAGETMAHTQVRHTTLGVRTAGIGENPFFLRQAGEGLLQYRVWAELSGEIQIVHVSEVIQVVRAEFQLQTA